MELHVTLCGYNDAIATCRKSELWLTCKPISEHWNLIICRQNFVVLFDRNLIRKAVIVTFV